MQAPDAAVAAKYLINTHMMVKVLEFHPETQTVDVIQEVYDYVNTTDGSFVVLNEFGVEVPANVKQLDVLYDIPVKQERFGQFSIRCCPKPGDTGYLEIFTEDIQDWVENGGPSVPWATLRFMRKNSVFVPFVPNKTNCATDYPTTNGSLVVKSNRITLTLTDPEDGQSAESVSLSMSNGVLLTVSADGSVTVACDSVGITADQTTIHGKLHVDGEVTTGSTIAAGGDVTTGKGTSLDNHTHLIKQVFGVTPATPTTVATTTGTKTEKPV